MYYIGIDGGGSSTTGCIGNGQSIIGNATVGASNYKGIGSVETQKNLEQLVKTLLSHVEDCKEFCVCFGGAGVDTQLDIKTYEKIFKSMGIEKDIYIVNDSHTALVGAVDALSGAVVISGTGSIVFGIDKNGTKHRVGGWGHIIGDQGSGYCIGKQALSLLTSYFDGIIEKSPIIERLMTRHHLGDKDSLINYVYGNNDKSKIASLAKEVIENYECDLQCKNIVDTEIELLTKQVIALYHHMGMPELKLATIGSVMNKSKIYKDVFIKTLNNKVASIEVVEPKYSPEMGAYILAKHLYNQGGKL
jgi:N-acetylglucosamine kinase-like BadF-type ATPase